MRELPQESNGSLGNMNLPQINLVGEAMSDVRSESYCIDNDQLIADSFDSMGEAKLIDDMEGYERIDTSEAMAKLSELNNKLDYVKVAEVLLGENIEDSADMWNTVGLLGSLPGMARSPQYYDPSMVDEKISQLGQDLEQGGFLSDYRDDGVLTKVNAGGEVINSEGATEGVLTRDELIDKFSTIVEVHTSLGDRYKAFDMRTKFTGGREIAPTAKALKALDEGQVNTRRYGVCKLPDSPELNDSIKQKVADFSAELPDYVHDLHDLSTEGKGYKTLAEASRELDSRSLLKGTDISGFGDAGVPRAEIEDMIKESIPPIAISGVKELQAFESLQRVDSIRFLHADGATISISKEAIMKGEDDSSEVDQGLLKELICKEYGEQLLDALPYAAVDLWDRAVKHDGGNVAEHFFDVPWLLSASELGSNRNEFAESVRLFVNRPSDLQEVSPSRFEAMNKIFEDFMPGFERK